MELLQYLMSHPSESFRIAAEIGTAFVIIEKTFAWVSNKLSWYYRKRKGIEDEKDLIKSVSDKIELLVKSQEEQNIAFKNLEAKMDKIEEDGRRRDCAILRDRILQAIRYFSKNVNPSDGLVHIPIAEYENLDHLFEEYFGAYGNGTVRKIYENDFQKWIIDK